jgi:hypothetical protein
MSLSSRSGLLLNHAVAGLSTFAKPEFSTLERVLASPKLLTEKNQELTIADRSSY